MNNHFIKFHTQKGAAMLLFVVFFMIASVALTYFVSRNVLSAITVYSLNERSKQAHYASESLAEDVAYRNIQSLSVDAVESATLFGTPVYATTTIDSVNALWTINASSNIGEAVRDVSVVLAQGTGASFNFGLQSGTGGISLSNNSSVVGNVFSNGDVIGTNSADVYGEVIAAGPGGLVQGFTATGTVWSNAIRNMNIGGDAYYVTDTASVVAGTRYTPSPDQATATMPISDEVIAEWQNNINTGGTIIPSTDARCSSGTYTINSDTTLGNVRINCNVEVRQNGTDLTLTGPVWIAGNLTFTQGPSIRVDAGVGARSVQMIVDNPSNRATSSKVIVNNSTNFYGSGNPKSYVLVLSMNNSAELGGAEIAIDLNQSANGDVLMYASHGLVDMGNNISLKEVTAHQISVSNGAQVIYESGLVNMLFTSGPGGGFEFYDWTEI